MAKTKITRKRKMLEIYNWLYKRYGPQGWWPILTDNKLQDKIDEKGYHKKDYSYPKTKKQQFEICLGAILAQNTAWKNVEKALINLKKINAINPKRILLLDEEKLKKAIKSSGYYNQKAKKIKEFTKFYISLNGKIPSRQDLLKVWGIGKETADSILLYAYKKPEFVVDAYTKKLLLSLNFIKPNTKYDEIKELFEKNLPKDYKLYQEYHALIVEHGKNKKQPEN